jgi:hypothetical protein
LVVFERRHAEALDVDLGRILRIVVRSKRALEVVDQRVRDALRNRRARAGVDEVKLRACAFICRPREGEIGQRTVGLGDCRGCDIRSGED